MDVVFMKGGTVVALALLEFQAGHRESDCSTVANRTATTTRLIAPRPAERRQVVHRGPIAFQLPVNEKDNSG